jgi:tRNA-intron endonuclease, archaea type
MKQTKFLIYIAGDRIFSNSQKALEIQDSKNLGEKAQGKVIYSPFEAFFLVETQKADILNSKTNKPLKEHELITLLSKKHKDFLTKYLVFKALKNKAYLVKTGSKFGADFRVYDSSMNSHAKYLVYPIKQSEKSNWNEFISKNRIAHSTAKKLLLAIVDSEDNVLFYEIDWMKI